MTELQEKEFELLQLFVELCNKNNLTYYLVCGSALGAVKYGGFIPWDDDIDVALPRVDYEKFLSCANDLPDWCFVQNYRTDPGFHLLGTKLRNSGTTYIEKMCGKLPINHGVFIDVFPLDGKWDHKRSFAQARRSFEGKRRVHLDYRRLNRDIFKHYRINYYFIMNRLFGLYDRTSDSIREFDDMVSSFDLTSSDTWCNYANSASDVEYAPCWHYGEGTWGTFEGMRVRIPENYDAYLTQKYGDWRVDLRDDQKVGHHYYEVCDLTRPYTDYIEYLPGGKLRIKDPNEPSPPEKNQ